MEKGIKRQIYASQLYRYTGDVNSKGIFWRIKTMKKKLNRFRELNPEERDALRVLIQNHLNTVSEISLHKEFRMFGYLAYLEDLEAELMPQL